MNIEQLLHERWKADATLNGLLASSKVSTGTYFASEPEFPYATITRPSDVPGFYDSEDSRVDNVLIRITIYHGQGYYDEALAICEAMRAAFDRTSFDLSGSNKVLNMQQRSFAALDDDDGDWYLVTDFLCRVYVP